MGNGDQATQIEGQVTTVLVRCDMCGLTRTIPSDLSGMILAPVVQTIDHPSLIDCIAALRVALRKAIRGHMKVDVKQ